MLKLGTDDKWKVNPIRAGSWMCGERILHDGYVLIRNRTQVYATKHDERFKVVVFLTKRLAYGAAKRLNHAERNIPPEEGCC